MIDKIKLHEDVSILDYLDRLGKDPNVFSMRLCVSATTTATDNIYVYAKDEEIVFVCIDIVRNKMIELADEEPFQDNPPLYFSEDSHRKSPVWALEQISQIFMSFLRNSHKDNVTIHHVLLTNSSFCNIEDMYEEWEEKHFTVIDDMFCVSSYNPVLNEDFNIPAAGALLKNKLLFLENPPKNPFSLSSEKKLLVSDKEIDNELGQYNGTIFDLFDKKLNGNTDSTFRESHIETMSEQIVQNDASKIKVQVILPFESPREELDKLVGCREVKTRLEELMLLSKYNKMMSQHYPNNKSHCLSLHSVFLGNPGTGKTTVCKIFGSLLKDAGVLSNGHVVICDRSTFMGGRWGDEERVTKQLLEKAKGGVLMIDEAYLFNTFNPSDPCKIVLPMLMDILADEKERDFAIVLCGYEKPMKQLMESNPGLFSRFPNQFHFMDFTFEELLTITLRRIKKFGYRFTRTAWNKYKSLLYAAYTSRDPDTWGNARYVATLLDNIYACHARRCVRNNYIDPKHVFTITTSDIIVNEENMNKPKPRIGFR